MTGLRGWLRARMGVRVVSALSAAVVVALALVVAGAALVFLVGQSLRTTVENNAVERAALVLSRLEGNYKGDEANENAREAVGSLLSEAEDYAQVIVRYGPDSLVVEAGTAPVGTARPITELRAESGSPIVVPRAQVPLADGSSIEAVVVVEAGSSGGRPVDVLLAMPLTAADDATSVLLSYLLVGVPILIVVAGFTTYLFAGRALRPVEAIRRQVAAMTEKDLERRVPVPAAHDEVGRLAETMNAMIARLQNAQGVQRRFVADASHELRSPLATIAAGLELMQNGAADAGTLHTLRGETERVNRLVDALLLLARADERGLQPRREDVDLDEVAEAERGRPGGVAVAVTAAPVRVIGDRGQLARVVRNLVDNARRHARSRVVVTVRRVGHEALVEVADDGPGVAPADRSRVFERFVRLDDARSRAEGGSGLGLAIVAEVVAAHGGLVAVTDAPGGGALFQVRLPAAPDPGPGVHPRGPARPGRAPGVAPVADNGGPGAGVPPAAPASPPGRVRPAPGRHQR